PGFDIKAWHGGGQASGAGGEGAGRHPPSPPALLLLKGRGGGRNPLTPGPSPPGGRGEEDGGANGDAPTRRARLGRPRRGVAGARFPPRARGAVPPAFSE